jgi:hypothetical protein
MADRVLWLEDGEAHLTEGGFTDALERRERRRAAKETASKPEKPAARFVAPSAPPPAPKSPFARLSREELEDRIASAELRLKELDASFARAEVYLDPARLKSAQQEHAVLRAELSGLEDEWLLRSR